MPFTVSEEAKSRLFDMFAKREGKQAALRVGVKGGGCSGYSYLFDFDESPATDEDKVFDYGDFKIFVDKKSYFFLNNTELDFVEEVMGSRFTFKNPNVTSTCGCGESIAF